MRVGNPTSYYYLTDAQGSIIKLVGSNGDVGASYFYCPTGNLAEPGSGQYEFTNPFRKYGAFYDWRFATYWMNGLQFDANSGNGRQLAFGSFPWMALANIGPTSPVSSVDQGTSFVAGVELPVLAMSSRLFEAYRAAIAIVAAGYATSLNVPHIAEEIENDDLTTAEVLDALRNPIQDIYRTNQNGLPQVKYIGEYATVVINDVTGVAITVWRTSQADLAKYGF